MGRQIIIIYCFLSFLVASSIYTTLVLVETDAKKMYNLTNMYVENNLYPSFVDKNPITFFNTLYPKIQIPIAEGLLFEKIFLSTDSVETDSSSSQGSQQNDEQVDETPSNGQIDESTDTDLTSAESVRILPQDGIKSRDNMIKETDKEKNEKDVPIEIPRDIPSDTAQDIQDDIPRDIPSDTAQDIQDDIPRDIPSDTTQDIPGDTKDETHYEEDVVYPFRDAPQDIPPAGIPQDIPSQDIPQNKQDDIPPPNPFIEFINGILKFLRLA